MPVTVNSATTAKGCRFVVVDDEPDALRSMETLLYFNGFREVSCFEDAREAMAFIKANKADVLLLDLLMPTMGGREMLDLVTGGFPAIKVIIITALADLHMAKDCVKAGAFDYLLKPLDPDRVLAAVRKALADRGSKSADSLSPENPEHFAGIITRSAEMVRLFRYVESVAAGSQPVLLTGETGVGKELFANALHRASGRKGKFVAINIAGLDEQFISDSLFGHVKGAFTGAHSSRTGLMEEASGGTLFLDEIGEMPEPSQVRLLRVLQEREYYPVGTDEPRTLQAGIVLATNRDLRAAMECGLFRPDLFYRIGSHEVAIPPLRGRPEDIPVLLEHFFARAAEEMGTPTPVVPQEIPTLLTSYLFPGNVRELKGLVWNVMRELPADGVVSITSILGKLDVQPPSLPPPVQSQPAPASADGGQVSFPERMPALKDVTAQAIDEALRRTNGNQRAAAKLLGLSQQAISKRLKSTRESK